MRRNTEIHRFSFVHWWQKYSCIRGKKSHADLTDAPQHGYSQIFIRAFVARNRTLIQRMRHNTDIHRFSFLHSWHLFFICAFVAKKCPPLKEGMHFYNRLLIILSQPKYRGPFYLFSFSNIFRCTDLEHFLLE